MNEFENIEEFETIILTDDLGEEIEFAIIDSIENNDNIYLLVVESKFIDYDEVEAIILKEISIDTNDIIYERVEDDIELNKVSELFRLSVDDYDFEVYD